MNIFILGFIFISLLGSFLHFTYDLSNHNKIVGLFSAVNESTWEHIKIALTPFFLWSIIDGFIFKTNPNYFFAKLIGLLTIILTIPILFYGYKFILKKSIVIIDISIFFISIFLSQYFSYLVLTNAKTSIYLSYFSLILIIIIFGIYLLLTLLPINNFIFKDPITKKYGFKGHK